MWGIRYWGSAYWGPRYWGKIGAVAVIVYVAKCNVSVSEKQVVIDLAGRQAIVDVTTKSTTVDEA